MISWWWILVAIAVTVVAGGAGFTWYLVRTFSKDW